MATILQHINVPKQYTVYLKFTQCYSHICPIKKKIASNDSIQRTKEIAISFFQFLIMP